MCSPARFPFFNLSRNESCQSVRKGDVESSNGCDSGLLLELEVERWNSKYDLECRGCCGSVCSCKSKQEWSLDGAYFLIVPQGLKTKLYIFQTKTGHGSSPQSFCITISIHFCRGLSPRPFPDIKKYTILPTAPR
ncbi:hypothetical protein AVEN_203469-1 [Araneus ventricosus]|uniref:Uncharacterized protein n=1 Tax=Araneus ventricosus TaxID=182803 RepID=A0A4Y2BIU6_ARAVE|nr:hypothetical protein AVEN_203469-1 [Araneus ventricosus]